MWSDPREKRGRKLGGGSDWADYEEKWEQAGLCGFYLRLSRNSALRGRIEERDE